jgi:hypothetical protein
MNKLDDIKVWYYGARGLAADMVVYQVKLKNALKLMMELRIKSFDDKTKKTKKAEFDKAADELEDAFKSAYPKEYKNPAMQKTSEFEDYMSVKKYRNENTFVGKIVTKVKKN